MRNAAKPKKSRVVLPRPKARRLKPKKKVSVGAVKKKKGTVRTVKTVRPPKAKTVKKTMPVKKVVPEAPKNDNIVREEIWIDPEKLHYGMAMGLSSVDYGIFKSDDRPEDIPADPKFIEGEFKVVKNSNRACFYALPRMIHGGGGNKVFSNVSVLAGKSSPWSSRIAELTKSEVKAWLDLCVKHEMLPPYVNMKSSVRELEKPEPIDKNIATKAKFRSTLVLDITKLTQGQLYFYLSNHRDLMEWPSFVRAAVYLAKNCGMNFYAAYCFATFISCSSNHHSLWMSRPYGGDSHNKLSPFRKLCNTSLYIGPIIGLQRFSKDPHKYDNKMAIDMHENDGFRCSPIICQISSLKDPIYLQEAFDEDVVKAIMSDTDPKAKRYIKGFKDKKIIYKKREQ